MIRGRRGSIPSLGSRQYGPSTRTRDSVASFGGGLDPNSLDLTQFFGAYLRYLLVAPPPDDDSEAPLSKWVLSDPCATLDIHLRHRDDVDHGLGIRSCSIGVRPSRVVLQRQGRHFRVGTVQKFHDLATRIHRTCREPKLARR
jgi:hypothetical protein